jgi:hypothetical protein
MASTEITRRHCRREVLGYERYDGCGGVCDPRQRLTLGKPVTCRSRTTKPAVIARQESHDFSVPNLAVVDLTIVIPAQIGELSRLLL